MTTSAGLRASRMSGASPIASSTPGRKLSTNIAAPSTSRSTAAIASAWRRFRQTERLLRQIVFQLVSMPATFQARSVSPSGGSIFTTSAP